MDVVLIIIAVVLSIVGIIGSIVPGLPGHPLNYIALLIIQWVFKPFSIATLIVMGVFTLIVLILDYFIPIWTAKKYGATKQGIIGSILGMFIGMFFTPVGMIAGAFAGAVIGDMLAGKIVGQATKSGLATLFGTLLSIGFKLILSITMSSLIAYEIFNYFVGNYARTTVLKHSTGNMVAMF